MKKLNVAGVNLALVDRGAGPVLVMVHGFPLDHSMWDAQVEAFAGQYRVVVPDLRGFGQSDVTSGIVTMERMADDLAALLDVLEMREPITLMGLSMGGYVSMAFSRRHAERLGRLILCDTRSAPDAPEVAKNREETARRVLDEGMEVLVAGMMPRLFGPDAPQDCPEAIERVTQVMLGTDPHAAAAAMLGMAGRPDSTPGLPDVRCPTLVIRGEHDAIVPSAEMRGMAERIPGATFVEIAKSGHVAPMEQPAAVNEAIARFLTESETATGS
jgi:pimeloyl-ACP methyl ester carboxylesterase